MAEEEKAGALVFVATRLEAEKADRLRQIAGREDRSVASMLRRLIDAELDRAA